MSRPTFVLRGCGFVRETDNAILVSMPDDPDEQIWIPLSQVQEILRGITQEQNYIVMSGWIAKQKGIIE